MRKSAPDLDIDLDIFSQWCSVFFYSYSMFYAMLLTVEDLERNDGSAEKPYYMSKELKEILGKKNVRADKED